MFDDSLNFLESQMRQEKLTEREDEDERERC